MEYKVPAKNESAEALEAQGEDYLYGHGVHADCGRAGKSLLAAAAQSSVKAQSVLGTMYATGHCVTRDVPVAYRWFAKASRQEPRNVRIQRDLEVLWQQMTPEEREAAAKTGP
jgi:TPR repeat protein